MKALRVSEFDGFVEVTLDRPAARNAIDAQMIAELHEVCEGTRAGPTPSDHHRGT